MRAWQRLGLWAIVALFVSACDSYWDTHDSYDYSYNPYRYEPFDFSTLPNPWAEDDFESFPNLPTPWPEDKLETPKKLDYSFVRKKLLENFDLRFVQGRKTPKGSEFDSWPYGVLLEISSDNLNFCSATHIKEGLVTAAAHCVRSRYKLPRAAYFLVYFDTEGNKAVSQIEDFLYVGWEGQDDIAYLKIDEETTKQWHALDAQLYEPEEDDIGARPPEVRTVTVWAFDPENTQDTLGAEFAPRTCEASYTRPVIVLGEDGKKDYSGWDTSSYRESEHLFLENCSTPIIYGNSGALISDLRSDKLMGVAQALVGAKTPKSSDPFDAFYFIGNGSPMELTREIYDYLFTLGTRFQKERIERPDSFAL